ncbi:MAG: anthranilate phosphoribosyltransferase [Phaeodactylibacter sp.]|nr:anthranilate phosphoribosyltransferase [Phaeodactylibacter sp.]
MKQILSRLYEHDRLSREEARQALLQISLGKHNHIQVASFITVFQMRSVAIQELQGFRDALLELCVPVNLNGMEAIDIVGTGGDAKNTFNVSTLSAVVVAGAGYKVVKHGSYGVSSAVGSSNVLMAMGYEFTSDEEQLKQQLGRSNICFLHAPLFHPALKEVVPVRKQLGVKTFFNMLGPLVNPAQPSHQLFGTFSQELARMYQYIMQETGRQFAIVYSLDGYDEVSLTGPFKLRTNERDVILTPEDLGKTQWGQDDLYGGETEEEAAAIFRNVLNNEGSPAQFDVVTANAGLAIHCLKPEQSMEDCMAEARESLLSKRALQAFKNLIN